VPAIARDRLPATSPLGQQSARLVGEVPHGALGEVEHVARLPAATMPAAHISAAPMQKAIVVSETFPEVVSREKTRGPLMPPAAVPIA